MSIGTVHTLGALVFTHASSGSFNVDAITDSNISMEITHRITHAAGRFKPSHTHTASAMPMIGYTTTDLATVLGSIDPDAGLAIDGGGSAFTSLDAFLTKMQTGGARASGSVNYRVRIVEALCTLGTLTLPHQGDATLSGEIHAVYDGTNAPFQFSEVQALPHTPSVDEKFTLGPVEINGTALDGVQRVTITFGVNVLKLSAGDDYYATFACIAQVDPLIEIVTKEVPVLNDYGLTGTAVTSSDVVIYAKKYSKGSNFVADATAEHIKFTIDDGVIVPRNAGGSNNAASDATLIVQPIDDGTNDPIVVSAASAIS